MIRATIDHHDNYISGFTIKGHADAGEYGQDIVCAAVSVLSISTINGLQEVAGLDVDVESDEENGGFLSLSIPIDKKESIQQIKSDAILQTFENGMLDIATNYSNFIQITIN